MPGTLSRHTALALATILVGTMGCGMQPNVSRVPRAELAPCVRTDCLRVLTWNLHAIPFASDRVHARLDAVADEIRAQQVDVVLLQELWLHGFASRLARNLASEYRMTRSTGCGRPFPCGGLAILVRNGSGWAASAPRFVRFDAAAPVSRLREFDGFARKGALLVALTRGAESLWVVDTHLQSEYPGYGRDYTDIRRRQLEQLDWIVHATCGRRPVVIGGDFNTTPDECSALYASKIASLGRDVTAANRAACGGCGTQRSPTVAPQWIDYVLARSLPGTAVTERIVNDAVDQPFSDHDGLLVRLDYDAETLR